MSQTDQVSLSGSQEFEAVRRAELGFGARLLKRLLAGMRFGTLRVVLPSGRELSVSGAEPGPEATVILRRWRAVRRLLLGGDVGFAEAWMDGDWTSPDLTSVIRLGARNTAPLNRALNGSLALRAMNRLRHTMNGNSKSGSRRNIEAHYDLGNDFYRLWLDPTMLYSSAIWTEETRDLEQAQLYKLDRILERLQMTGGESVLEIGCGWGALASSLAENKQASVVGLTLSPSQLSFARDVVASRGLSGQIDLRIEDYRDVKGQFDRIVSIEMFEAVGEAYWADYFAALKRCLKPCGKIVLQIISINEDRFEAYRQGTDFIQKHVFPGGFLPSKTALRHQIVNAGLQMSDAEFFSRSYALTLADWRARFDAHWPQIAALGFDERFQRLWQYYLCYSEAGFMEEAVDVGLYTLEHAST